MMTRKNTFLIICLVLFSFWVNDAGAQHELASRFEKMAKAVKGNVGVCVINIEADQLVSYNGDKHFPMQSVYKFPIAMCALAKVDSGSLALDQGIAIKKSDYIPAGHSPLRDQYPDGTTKSLLDVLRYNIVESDGSACDVLLAMLGGCKSVNDYVHALGVKNIAIVYPERTQLMTDSAQYMNWSTPLAMSQLLSTLYTGKNLSDTSRSLLLNLMKISTPEVKRISLFLPRNVTVAHKTGTSWTKKGITAATNDVGIIYLPNGNHLAVSVFISDAEASKEKRDSLIAGVAKAAYDYWTKQ